MATNPATGRDDSQNARLNALRDRQAAALAAQNKATRRMLSQNQSRRKPEKN